ncbi:hypothetical protein CEUSTIGMA_g76.t1 [Chlamydomonas eustigma]|uniref:non-specific serine/threonine protein kinase n=1 Tax=Chlamydomonas eustigma TaxID=1157962 RepID=A0A250WPZ9_9CHLO|nr:hypothetical protein CEUSTIGMA_g76.t1 [Chlamydomonas eustigma]|eukprot:GAX72620.1 hypothetical protein CEUSTIGMA_g76.t1 [Chlamydomonas eustigma]
MKEKIDRLRTDLCSDKSTERKAGFKSLTALIGSPAFISFLDAETCQVKLNGPLKVYTWPGLLDMYLTYMEKELDAKKKISSNEVEVLKGLKSLVKAADDSTRAGPRHQLHRRICKTVQLISNLICMDGFLERSAGLDYLTFMKSHLLLPEYIQLISKECAQDILDELIKYLDGIRSKCMSETVPMGVTCVMEVVGALVGDPTSAGLGVAGIVSQPLCQNLIACLCRNLVWMFHVKDQGRPSLHTLSCLNYLLLECGLDQADGILLDIHAAVYPFIKQTWPSSRLPRLKELLIQYLLIQIRLGVIWEAAAGLNASLDDNGNYEGRGVPCSHISAFSTASLLCLVYTDINTDEIKWQGEGRNAQNPLSKFQMLYLQLAAELEYLHMQTTLTNKQSFCRGGVTAFDQDEHTGLRTNKRAREIQPIEDLLDRVAAFPHRWMPVLAEILRLHGSELVEEALQEVAWRLKGIIEGLLNHGLSVMVSTLKRPSPPTICTSSKPHSSGASGLLGLLWSFRAVQQLAHAWKKQQYLSGVRDPCISSRTVLQQLQALVLRSLTQLQLHALDEQASSSSAVAFLSKEAVRIELIGAATAVFRTAMVEPLGDEDVRDLWTYTMELMSGNASLLQQKHQGVIAAEEGTPPSPLCAFSNLPKSHLLVLTQALQTFMRDEQSGAFNKHIDNENSDLAGVDSSQAASPIHRSSFQSTEIKGFPGSSSDLTSMRSKLIWSCLDSARSGFVGLVPGLAECVLVLLRFCDVDNDPDDSLNKGSFRFQDFPLPTSSATLTSLEYCKQQDTQCELPDWACHDKECMDVLGQLDSVKHGVHFFQKDALHARARHCGSSLASNNTTQHNSSDPPSAWIRTALQDSHLWHTFWENVQHLLSESLQRITCRDFSPQALMSLLSCAAVTAEVADVMVRSSLGHKSAVEPCERQKICSNPGEWIALHTRYRSETLEKSLVPSAVWLQLGRILMVSSQFLSSHIQSAVGNTIGNGGAASANELMPALPLLHSLCRALHTLFLWNTRRSTLQASSTSWSHAQRDEQEDVINKRGVRVSETTASQGHGDGGGLGPCLSQEQCVGLTKQAGSALQLVVKTVDHISQVLDSTCRCSMDVGCTSAAQRVAKEAAEDDFDLLTALLPSRGAGGTQQKALQHQRNSFSTQIMEGRSTARVISSQKTGEGGAYTGQLSSDSVAAPLDFCVALLQALSPASPFASCEAVTKTHATLVACKYQAPAKIWEGLVACLAHCISRDYEALSRRYLPVLKDMLMDECGVLSWKSITPSLLMFVTAQVRLVLQAALDFKSLRNDVFAISHTPLGESEALDILVPILKLVHERTSAEAVEDGNCQPWRLRAELAAAGADLFRLDAKALEEGRMMDVDEALLAVLSDPCFQARRLSRRMITVLLESFPQGHTPIFTETLQPALHLLPCLHNASLANSQQIQPQSVELGTTSSAAIVSMPETCLVETSLLLAVEVAACSGDLEMTVVMAILGHSSKAPKHASLCQHALDLLGCKMGYNNRVPYLAFQIQMVISQWFTKGYSLLDFLALQSTLMGGYESGSGSTAGSKRVDRTAMRERASTTLHVFSLEDRAFASQYAAVLAAVMVPIAEEMKDLSGLQLLATLLDEADVKSLVKKHFDTIFAFSWPHVAVGDGKGARVVCKEGWLLQRLGIDPSKCDIHLSQVSSTALGLAFDQPAAGIISEDSQTEDQLMFQDTLASHSGPHEGSLWSWQPEVSGAVEQPDQGTGSRHHSGPNVPSLFLHPRVVVDALRKLPSTGSMNEVCSYQQRLGMQFQVTPHLSVVVTNVMHEVTSAMHNDVLKICPQNATGVMVIRFGNFFATGTRSQLPATINTPWVYMSAAEVMHLLLVLQRHMMSARHPRHRLQRSLAAATALVHLITPHLDDVRSEDLNESKGRYPVYSWLLSPHRYLVHLLVIMLKCPELQVQLCKLIRRLMQNAALLSGCKHASPSAHLTGCTSGVKKKVGALASSSAKKGKASGDAVAASVGGAGGSVNAVGEVLAPLISGLVSALKLACPAAKMGPGSSAAAGERGHDAIKRLIVELTVQAPTFLQAALRTLHPLPELDGLKEVTTLQKELHESLSLPLLLSHFSSSVVTMSETSRHESVQRLYNQLRTRARELVQQQLDGVVLRPGVSETAHRLILAAAQMGDTELACLAGYILAADQPWGSIIVQGTSTPDSPSMRAKPFHETNAEVASIVSKTGRQDKHLHALAQVLQLLESFLFDKDLRVIQRTQAALRHMLSHPEGRDALGLLQSETFRQRSVYHTLKSFQTHPPALQFLSLESASHSMSTIADAMLWKAPPLKTRSLSHMNKSMMSCSMKLSEGGQVMRQVQALHGQRPAAFSWARNISLWSSLMEERGVAGLIQGGPAIDYDTWVRRLTCALLQRCCCPVLRGLSRIAQLKVSVSEVLMPEALFHLSTSPEVSEQDAGMRRMLSRLLSEHILQPRKSDAKPSPVDPSLSPQNLGMAEATDPRAVRLMLRCLDRLRKHHVDYYFKLTRRPQNLGVLDKGKQDGKCESVKSLPLGAGGDDLVTGLEPELWPKAYCLDIDYLDVAEAAARCKAPLTALMYIEKWFEEKAGDRSLLHGLQRLEGGGWVGGNGLSLSAITTDSSSRARVEALLLGVYSSAEDVDSLYALSGRATALSTDQMALLYEHERRWDQAVQQHDISVRQSGQGASSTQGMARSLMRMGGHQAALMYLQREVQLSRLSPCRDQESSTESNLDLMYELSWRLGKWEDNAWEGMDLHSLRPQSSINSHIFTALKSLATDSERNFMEALSSMPSAALGLVGSDMATGVLGEEVEVMMSESLICNSLISFHGSDEDKQASSTLAVNCLMISMLREAACLKWPQGGLMTGRAASLLVGQDWRRLIHNASEYEQLSPLIALSCSCLSAAKRPELLISALTTSACTARKAGDVAGGLASLQQLKLVTTQMYTASNSRGTIPVGSQNNHAWCIEEARLLWVQGQQQQALHLVQNVVKAVSPAINSTSIKGLQQPPTASSSSAEVWSQQGITPIQLVTAMGLAGKWMAERQWTNGPGNMTVLEYLQKAAAYLPCQMLAVGTNKEGNPSSLVTHAQEGNNTEGSAAAASVTCKLFYRLACYSDQRYKELCKLKMSPEFARQARVMDRKMEMIRTMEHKVAEPGIKDQMREWMRNNIKRHKSPVTLDEEYRKGLDCSEALYLSTCWDAYGQCMQHGCQYDMQSSYRLCQLWMDLKGEDQANKNMQKVFDEVPSYKFVPLMYLLATRLSSSEDDHFFQKVLKHILSSLVKAHPHHTLLYLLALKNGDLNDNGQRGDETDRSGLFQSGVDRDKVVAAQRLFQQIIGVARNFGDSAMLSLLQQYDIVASAYIELAAIKAPKQDATMPLPGKIKRIIEEANLVPLLSVTISVSTSASYLTEELPMTLRMETTIKFPGGVNKPKLVEVTDSFGKRRRLLVKSGNDDLRQDDVIRQFFGLFTALMQQTKGSSQRSLQIRTYKVVPFSPFAGMIEWVNDTVSLMEYLVTGPQPVKLGAHTRHAQPPRDLTFPQAFEAIKKNPFGNPLKTYLSVCERFPPVMHHFFTEMYQDPTEWFQRRVAYTRSVAASSMAGYIIGLGDRHSSNILLDKRTAEVVHIDLGIAFEQGQFLSTPELVPFRLTRDIVDGMGIAGTEGIMRRCCEDCMQVLRSSKDSLMTVVSVVIADPLYKWAMTPIKAEHRQREQPIHVLPGRHESDALPPPEMGHEDDSRSGGESIGNADAERVVLRVRQKLDGVEGDGGPRSVEGQVAQLLHDAQDPEKLSRMYVGWAAWL